MKIATFNVNNVNKRLANLLRWLREARPDVVCLQELKAADRDFPAAALAKAGYAAVWRGQKSWNGVAILARGTEPVLTRTALPGDADDSQSRYIEAAVRGVLIASLYAPNGNPQPGPKFDYKLAWMRRLAKHARALHAADVPVVLAGDFNVVPTDFDIYFSKSGSYADNALVQPQSRSAFARLVAQGWVDAIRAMYPEAPMYTFWDYLRNRWPRDAGLRLDHLLLSPKARERLAGAGVDRAVRGLAGASDHAPAWIELSDQPLRRSRRAKPVAKPQPAAARARAPKRAAARGPLLVIDGDSFAHRSYHALPKTILTRDKRPAGAMLGFANFLVRLYQAERPRAVIACWDTYAAPTYRHEALPAYQGGRDFDDAIIEQLKIIPDFVAACGFVNAKGAGYEADDFLAAAAAAEERRGGRVLVASGDRDTFQLASAHTTILYPLGKGEMVRIGPAQVRERYGVDPKQVPDFIALRGDPSDRIPGAPGLGAEGAAALLRQYGTLERALKAGRYSGHAAKLRLYRAIATMDRKAPLPSRRDQKPTWQKAAAFADKLGLEQLARRLAALAKVGR
jgi:exodeoxyribonuclease III